jgi:AraC-type DNA-binding domain-containing proteins
MNTYYLRPKDTLQPFVQQYIVLQNITSAADIAQKKLFTLGKQYLVFIQKGALAFKPNDHASFELPEASVTGPFTCAVNARVTGPLNAVVVQLNAYASHRLMGISMESVTNYFRDLTKVDNSWGFTAKALSQADNLDTIQNILDRVLEDLLPKQKPALRQVDEMVDYLAAQKGQVEMLDLALRFKTSRHTLERQFMEVTGLTPQLYSRILRRQRYA